MDEMTDEEYAASLVGRVVKSTSDWNSGIRENAQYVIESAEVLLDIIHFTLEGSSERWVLGRPFKLMKMGVDFTDLLNPTVSLVVEERPRGRHSTY